MSDAVPAPPAKAGTPRVRFDGRLRLASAGLAGVVLVLAVIAFATFRSAMDVTPAAASVGPLRPRWIDVPHPVHVFSLEAPLLRGLAETYSARRLAGGTAREDLLVFGTPGFDAPAARFRVRRDPDAAAAGPPAPLFTAVAREAADAGLSVERAGLPDLVPTRFGGLEIVDLVLADSAGAAVPCTGLRVAHAAPGLLVGGFACGALGKPLERAALGCLVDRLNLASAGEDRTLIEVIASLEAHRDPSCEGARPAPADRHAAWLDDKPATRARSLRPH